MLIRSIVLLFILSFFSSSLFANDDANLQAKTEFATSRTTITVKLKAKEQFILNYTNNFGTHVNFTNYGSSDTLVTKVFLLTKPTIFHNILDPVTNDFRSLIVLPGDSILLGIEKEVTYSSSFPGYIENLINIPPLFYQYNPFLIKALNDVSADSSFKFIDRKYEYNCSKIRNSNLTGSLKNILGTLNDLIKYQLFSYIDVEKLTLKEGLLLDSINNSTIDHIKKVDAINTSMMTPLIKYLIEWKYATKNLKPIKDFWADINDLDTDVVNAPYYVNYLIDVVQTYFIYDYKKLSVVAASLRGIENPNPAVKNVLLFCDILLKTKSDFKSARQALERFADGKYVYLFKNEEIANHEMRNTRQIKPAVLSDVKGQKLTFAKLLNDDEAIFVVDFWASWCKPCIHDYPFLERARNELKNESVKFISISIDDVGSNGKWQAMLKKLGAHSDTNQFILENANESSLRHFFKINTIPRYVIVDAAGNLLDEDFLRPSDSRFVLEIKKLTIND